MIKFVMIVVTNDKGEFVIQIKKSSHSYGTYHIADQECMLVMVLPFYTPISVVRERLLLRGVINPKLIELSESLSEYPMTVSDETILFEVDDIPARIRIGMHGIVSPTEEVNHVQVEKFSLSCHHKRMYEAAKILRNAKQHLSLYLCIDAFGIFENKVCYVDIVI